MFSPLRIITVLLVALCLPVISQSREFELIEIEDSLKQIRDIAVGDLNNDGLEDFVTTHYEFNNEDMGLVNIWMQDPDDNNWITRYTIDGFGWVRGVNVVDFDDDGDLDILVCEQVDSLHDNDIIKLMLRNENDEIEFEITEIYCMYWPNEVIAVDLDDNGDKDLVVAAAGWGGFDVFGGIQIFWQSDSMEFEIQELDTFWIGGWQGLYVTDIDADEDFDIIGTEFTSAQIDQDQSWWEFVDEEFSGVREFNHYDKMYDVNRDGYMDVTAIIENDDEDIREFVLDLNESNGRLDFEFYGHELRFSNDPLDFQLLDYNGDGNTDVAIFDPLAPELLINDGEFGFESISMPFVGSPYVYPPGKAVLDYGDDGFDDMIAFSDDGTLTLLLNTDDNAVNPIRHNQLITYCLHSSYPNPFNNSTVISYSLPITGKATLNVFDLQGRRVETLLDVNQNAGEFNTVWSPQGLTTGTYFVELDAVGERQLQKVLYLK